MATTIAWSRRAADELWSGVVTPLTFSVLAEQMAEHMAQRRLRQAGLIDASQAPVFRLIRGHVYVNASLLAEVMREVPSVLLSDGVLALLPEPLRADLADRSRALYDPRTLTTVLRLTWNERSWAPWSRAELFRREAAGVASELDGFDVGPETDPRQIARQISDVCERLGRFLDVVSWAMIYAYLFFHLAVHLTRDWLSEGESLGLLAGGASGIRTFEAHEELRGLADRLRGDAGLRAAVEDRPAGDVLASAMRGELAEFGDELLAVRRRHGHRLVARDLVFPTWRERPEVLVEMVRRLAASERVVRRDPSELLARAKGEISAGLLGSVRWRLFERGLSWCQEYYAVRENMRYHADYFLAALRGLALAASRQLVSRGSLAAEDDVFYLTKDELDAALVSADGDGGLAHVAEERRREYDAYRKQTPPEVVWGDAIDDDPTPGPVEVAASKRLRATAASPGVIEGTARVVRSVEELDAVQSGDVIIAQATDPTWTSYLSLASGLVLEVGGLLSHGAIIARELGIPAVVDLAGATTRLQSGERIRVDGSTGRVERL